VKVLERNRRDVRVAYGLGVISAGVFFLMILLVAWLFGK
jgi:hypothetical protein